MSTYLSRLLYLVLIGTGTLTKEYPLRKRIITLLMAFGVVLGGASVVEVATATPADASLKEWIWNVYESDGSNHVIGVTWKTGRFETIAPGVRISRDIRSFTLPSGICAMVKYNGGTPQLRGPGTHTRFVDGVVLTIDPHRC